MALKDWVGHFGNYDYRLCAYLHGVDKFPSRTPIATYVYSEGAVCFYFTGGLVDKDKLFFKDAEGKRRWRAVIGFKSVGTALPGRRKRYCTLASACYLQSIQYSGMS